MSFQELMLTYGYPILFVGVMLESEAFLIVAVYLAHRGYFSLPVVIAVAAVSSFTVTQFCFFLGQRYGMAFLNKHPKWHPRFIRVHNLVERYGQGLVLGYRAIYGLRGAIPAALGLANYSQFRFVLLNAIGAAVWAVVVALAGNSIAQTAEQVFDKLRNHEQLVIIVLYSLGLLWGLFRLYRRHQLNKTAAEKPTDMSTENKPPLRGRFALSVPAVGADRAKGHFQHTFTKRLTPLSSTLSRQPANS